jgi:hypothetical protein
MVLVHNISRPDHPLASPVRFICSRPDIPPPLSPSCGATHEPPNRLFLPSGTTGVVPVSDE